MTVAVFGSVISLAYIFTILFLEDWQDASNTQNSVWPDFQTSRSSTVCGILISTPFAGFVNVVRHGFDILSLIVFLSFYLEENLK